MEYKDHPLNRISDKKHYLQQPVLDMTNDEILNNTEKSFFDLLKKSIGFYLYPLKNKLEAIRH